MRIPSTTRRRQRERTARMTSSRSVRSLEKTEVARFVTERVSERKVAKLAPCSVAFQGMAALKAIWDTLKPR